VDYVEAHGSGTPREDLVEARALRSAFPGALVGSAKAEVGHAGAAAALLSLVKAGLALHHRILPGLRPTTEPRAAAAGLRLADAPRYWLKDRAATAPRAVVGGMSVSGACAHAVLEAGDRSTESQPLGAPREALFAVEADDPAGLRRGLAELREVATQAPGLHAAAWQWWQAHGARPDAARAVALVADTLPRLRELIDAAETRLVSAGVADEAVVPRTQRLFSSEAPLGRSGEVAFVYPGSGAHFPGMGRDLAVAWPEVLRAQEQRTDGLASQLLPERVWRTRDGAQECSGSPIPCSTPESCGSHASGHPTPADLILAQVALGSLVTDVVRQFGVRPAASIGYSLGETAGMFALGAWGDRDEMLRRVRHSTLFTEQLAGPCHAARRAFDLRDDQTVDWVLGVIDRPAEEVRAAIDGRSRVYLLLVNTHDECVIGGQRCDVDAAVRALGASWHPLHGVTTVHCAVAESVAEEYRALHVLPTTPPNGVRFYSAAAARAVPLDSEAAADSILAQALHGHDFPRLIEQAYADGVRVFLEMGPGSTCSRMIRKILAGRPFVARSACAPGIDGPGAVLRALASLVSERVPVDLAPLYCAPDAPPQAPEAGAIVVPVGRDRAVPPVPPPRDSAPAVVAPARVAVQEPAATSPSPALANPVAVPAIEPRQPVLAPVSHPLVAAAAATAAAH
ncbi:MAG: type I polyketide synthase, partial [Planctomycetes bacterium]|nr:type I polyketide synthase [Planctomycetota bacterium]